MKDIQILCSLIRRKWGNKSKILYVKMDPHNLPDVTIERRVHLRELRLPLVKFPQTCHNLPAV